MKEPKSTQHDDNTSNADRSSINCAVTDHTTPPHIEHLLHGATCRDNWAIVACTCRAMVLVWR